MNAISKTDFQFPDQTNVYHGKVRDVYSIGDKHLVMIATDRISAFDVVLPEPIPYKGQVLNQVAAQFLEATRHIVPNWVNMVPDPNVTIGKKCMPFKVEMVIRGYLSGHAWREYKAGKRMICGVAMPDGMKENDQFPEPIITPTSKAEQGHDLDLSREDILAQSLVTEAKYSKLESYTRKLFDFGSRFANERGLILVDTKYEFGEVDENLRSGTSTIYLIDEIHTPDSSRYFYLDGYEDRQKSGEPQKQLSKEFVREWLIENNFMGKEGESVPEMTSTWINTISERYIELFEKVTGRKFEKPAEGNIMDRIEQNILSALSAIQ